MGAIEDMLGALSGMEGATHPWLMQVMRGLSGNAGDGGRGLGWLLRRLRESGHGAAIDAWASSNTRAPLAPHDLHAAIGDADLGDMARRAQLSPDEFVGKLSQHLPGIVQQLSRDGVPPG